MDEELLQRQAPQALEAEQSVLGSMLIDERCVPATRKEKHRTNFSAISWTRQNLSIGDICILAGLLTASEPRWKKRA